MIKKIFNSKRYSILFCLSVYIIAIVLAWISVDYFEQYYSLILATLLADVVATIVVFIFSSAFRNASLYDPYWSMAPLFILGYWSGKLHPEPALFDYLLLGIVVLWSIRLTLNWLRGWRGLHHEDWRYVQLREQNPKSYPLINFAGIHLFPTVMVFLCMVPCYFALQQNTLEVNYMMLSGFIICFAAILISLVADEQLRAFRIREVNKSINTGLWKYSRHPNYLGEILFWIGMWMISFGANSSLYWTALGFILLIMMFAFISIPMMEKRNLSRRSDYAEIINKVPMFI